MRRALVATFLALLVSTSAYAELAQPGETLVLHRGFDPATASAMPGGQAHDGRLVHHLPRTAPAASLLGAHTRPRGPVVDAAGRMVIGTSTGVAVLAPDGSLLSEAVVGLLEASPVLVPGGDVIAFSRNGMIARVSIDGTVLARSATELGARFAPLVLDDGSFVVAGVSRTVARFGADLEERFRTELPDGFAHAPTLTASGRIAVATGSELVVLDLDGVIVRSISLPGRAVGSAARASDGSLWVPTADGDLVQIAHESRVRRTIPLGARLSDGATIGVAPSGDLVVAVPTRGLVALAPDGSERWVATVSAPFFGFFAIDPDGRTAALDRLSRLSAISSDGAVEWTVNLGAVPLAAPVVLPDGAIAVATDRGIALLR